MDESAHKLNVSWCAEILNWLAKNLLVKERFLKKIELVNYFWNLFQYFASQNFSYFYNYLIDLLLLKVWCNNSYWQGNLRFLINHANVRRCTAETLIYFTMTLVVLRYYGPFHVVLFLSFFYIFTVFYVILQEHRVVCKT